MAVCLTCNAQFLGDEQFCPRDGTPLQVVPDGDRFTGRMLSGRYRLMDRLGQGGMGAVYRAHHILMDKPVAVKVLRLELASDAEAVARFHREARSASRLDHEHIIRVTDFGQSDDGLLFLVMELLDGESLADALRHGPLPWRRAAAIARDVALGLSHAHEQGIVHRDLKPENIMLSRRQRSTRQTVKVLDFGLAKLMHEVGPGISDKEARERMSLTRTGVVFGTPEYMSPEQAEGLPLDQRTDIYALGVMMYQMVTGDVPFTAPTVLALIAKTVQETPQPPSARLPGAELPPSLEALILRCLEKSPDRRPQSAEEIAAELELLAGTGALLAEGRLSSPSQPPGGESNAFAPTLTDTPAQPAALALSATPQGHAASGAAHAASGAPSITPPARTAPTPARPLSAYAQGAGDSIGMPLAVPHATPENGLSRPTPPVGMVAQPFGEHPGVAFGAAPSSGMFMAGVSAGGIAPASAPAAEVPDLLPPRRGLRWTAGLVAVVAIGAVTAAPRLLRRPPPAAVRPAERDPLATVRELLDARKVDDALAVLATERQRGDSPPLQRLFSQAYEAQNNRLRAMGHMYAALTLATGGPEAPQSQISLAQLLSRFGHTQESCRLVEPLLDPQIAAPIRQQAESLLRSHRCPRRAP